ncbi:MFS transporter [Paenibacillus thermoaerophilus]|uniref:MFS transporter n=1 Tax=Paenibacillus thermoaerophilus TaxID=1215385 RepID=A0ABW2V2E5_9BACL|nr:MFS transporter [Paenibacillus thermoaerophilus]TMV08236.1 MFS transporter [Paenibacillus thermoaerophilus]
MTDRRLIFLASLSYLVIGMAHVVAGAVLEPMMDAYALDYSDGGQFIMNQFLGFLAGVLAGPWLSGRLGRRGAILLALGALAATEAVYTALPPWGWMLAIAPVAGFGFGLTEAVIGALVIDSIRERKASAMTLVETFFGVGALLMPAAAALLIRFGSWRLGFPLIAVSALASLILWKLAPKAESSPASPGDAEAAARNGGRYRPGQLPFLMLAILYFLFYVGMEMSFSNYLPSILMERASMEEAFAAAGMSLFWGTMVVGRLFAGRLAERIGYVRYLVFATAGGFFSLLLIRVAEGAAWSLMWTGINGLAWSGVFAVGLVYANRVLAGMTDRTTSLLVAFGGVGGALFPRLSGSIMDQAGAAWALGLFVALAGAMLLCAAAMMAAGRRLEQADGYERSPGTRASSIE